MSRQSKGRRIKALAAEFTKLRKAGSGGPVRTTPKHGKRTRTPANVAGILRPAGWAKAALG